MTDRQGAKLSADLRSVVFSIAAARGDAAHVQQLRTLYEASDFIEEKLNCLSSIGLIKSIELKREVVEWALKNVRSQDIQGHVAYIKTNWAALNAQYAPNIVGRIVLSVIGRFHSEAHAQEVEQFLATRKHHAYDRLLDAALERIRIKAACVQRDRDNLAQWLEQQQQQQ
ncbi:hypothetical protein PINS_up023183 [Pythium insidiosum]|nr:hypothetical protein PINS_up023183 [Pythium insidiosum]